jgi:hypothetical protein
MYIYLLLKAAKDLLNVTEVCSGRFSTIISAAATASRVLMYNRDPSGKSQCLAGALSDDETAWKSHVGLLSFVRFIPAL